MSKYKIVFDLYTMQVDMKRIGASDARDNLSEVVDRVRYTHERVVLTKRGRAVGAIISIDDLKLLEMLEAQLDVKAAKQALKNLRGNVFPMMRFEKS